MSKIINFRSFFAITLSIIMLSGIGLFGFTQEAQSARRAPHNKKFVDSRYRHNHSYPARGHFVQSLPRDHRVVIHGPSRYYSYRGAWYRPEGRRFVVVAPPIGLFMPFLPLAYATIWLHGIPYYYANDTYYTRTAGGYVVVEPPQGEVSQTPPATAEGTPDITENKMFIYPRNGQTEEQQSLDRYECHKWSVDKTKYDPTIIPSGMSDDQIMQNRADYQSAMGACLDGRGYTTK